MPKHTPGPWRTMVAGATVWSEGRLICDPSNGNAYPTDEHKANARLIASAPEMLEVLERALHELDSAYNGATNFAVITKQKIRAAIAMANGETSDR